MINVFAGFSLFTLSCCINIIPEIILISQDGIYNIYNFLLSSFNFCACYVQFHVQFVRVFGLNILVLTIHKMSWRTHHVLNCLTCTSGDIECVRLCIGLKEHEDGWLVQIYISIPRVLSFHIFGPFFKAISCVLSLNSMCIYLCLILFSIILVWVLASQRCYHLIKLCQKKNVAT